MVLVRVWLLKLEFTFEDNLRGYILDGRLIHTPPPDLQVVLLRADAKSQLSGKDDLNGIASVLSSDRTTVRELVAEIARNGSPGLRRMRFVDEEKEDRPEEDGNDSYVGLRLLVDNSGFEQPFGSLSGSETDRVFMEFAAALSRERSRTGATILLIDGTGRWSFTKESWAMISEGLISQPFQTAITMGGWMDLKDQVWEHWGRVRLTRTHGSGPTRIEAIR